MSDIDMIRRLFALCIFSATVTFASFGQEVFGREHLINLAHEIQAKGPEHAEKAWHETDKLLASLAPEAGSERNYCAIETLAWAKYLYQ